MVRVLSGNSLQKLPRGDTAINTNALSVEGFNVILKRELIELMSLSGATSFILNHVSAFPGVESVTPKHNLIAVRFTAALHLEEFVKELLNSGLRMSTDGMFEDFAIVHGTHGLAMPCDWLEFRHDEEGGRIWEVFDIVGSEPEPSNPEEHDDMEWVTGLGHGFMLSRNDDHDVWLDFSTGRTVVSLKPRQELAALLS